MIFPSVLFPLPSHRQHLSCDDYLEAKRQDNQNCFVVCYVQQLNRVIHIQVWAVLKSVCRLGLGFFLCFRLKIFVSLCSVCALAYMSFVLFNFVVCFSFYSSKLEFFGWEEGLQKD